MSSLVCGIGTVKQNVVFGWGLSSLGVFMDPHFGAFGWGLAGHVFDGYKILFDHCASCLNIYIFLSKISLVV